MDKKAKEALQQKAINMIHLARKAGKVKFGFDAARRSCETGKSCLVLLSVDLAAGSKRKIDLIARGCNVKIMELGLKKDFGEAFDLRDPGLISIEDGNFARGIRRILDTLEE